MNLGLSLFSYHATLLKSLLCGNIERIVSVSFTHFFKSLGAPLANPRWSWGATRSADNALFLRVWQDECRMFDGKRHVLIGYIREGAEQHTENPGRNERREHIKLIEGGARAYLIMCQARDVAARPREIKTFDATDVFVGGALRKVDEAYWLELADRRPAREVAA